MVKELSYTTINEVIESWEALKRTKNYQVVAGTKLFKGLFLRCPQAKVLFGFPIDIDVESPELLQSKRFLAHAAYLLEMIDTSLNMLGPDIELLTEIMAELGVKHLRYGVKAEMFPHMGESLLLTLEETLGDAFTANIRDSWKETFDALSGDMIAAQRNKAK